MGTADAGHYYSLIKVDASDRWVEFNDTIVRPFNVDDLPLNAFGGCEQSTENMDMGQEPNSKNLMSSSAYMLLYERNVCFDENGQVID